MDTLQHDAVGPDAIANARRVAWTAERIRIERSPHWVGPDGRLRPRWRSRAFDIVLHTLGAAIWLAGLYRRGVRNALAVSLEAIELWFPELPEAFDGYRILHLSDTHLDVLPELAPVAQEMLRGVAVDFLAFTGDVLGRQTASLQAATAPLTQLLDGLLVCDRRVAILGNHDPAAMAEALEALGFELLLNRSMVIERGGARISVTGLDDVHKFYTASALAALREPCASDFRIPLVHTPEMADHAAAAGFALYLCGHTHGGQICLPGGRPLVTHLVRCQRFAQGLWREGALQGYTSRGLGVSFPPVRYNCRGEMTLITLRRGGSGRPEPT